MQYMRVQAVPPPPHYFCSHWRSWRYWAESLTGGELLARRCDDYDSFVRGQCREAPLVQMGVKANHDTENRWSLGPKGSPTRWTDDLVQVACSRWMQAASSRGNWRSMGEAYVQEWTSYG
ncbi:hypothetical protein MSG28_011657 [Choristoneura fumiferana]|uniref:Uncharacterized protein n=1 Tax=Choristoneura fumiferana TaxID=7141 RepID=A0ACC0KLA5_CHOFU|nr:hypothetical protein MSG28_011657 [Choristoneura fumiferana]